MALPLLALLIGGYILIGLVHGRYSWRARIMLLILTGFGPAGFYFFF